MPPLGWTHTAAALAALMAGAAVLLTRKGTRRHRRLGWIYARALERHYQWMTWSYVGLAAAAVSEIATRMPALRPRPEQLLAFGVTVAVATLLVVGVGVQLIRHRR